MGRVTVADQRAEREAPEPVNHVHLRGRLSGVPLQVDLPSGDTLVSFRVVVSRGAAERKQKLPSGRRPPSVDTIDCVVRTATLRRKILATTKDSEVELTGALRRRFYRGAGGLGSRYEVEITSLTKVPASVSP